MLKGTEVDILEDGSLAQPDEVLRGHDVVVIAIHSHFDLRAAGRLNLLAAGVRQAQRGWATKQDILNVQPIRELRTLLRASVRDRNA